MITTIAPRTVAGGGWRVWLSLQERRPGRPGGRWLTCETAAMNGDTTMTIPGNDPAAVQLVLAIRAGDTSTLGRLLEGRARGWRGARIAETGRGTRDAAARRHRLAPATFPAARRPSGC